MILGNIIGKTTTKSFNFEIKNKSKKFEYIQIPHSEYGYILGQIVEIEKDSTKEIGICNIIGYKDENGIIKQIRIPPSPSTEVLLAEDDFIKDVLQINTTKGAFIGKLDGKQIDIHLDLKKLLTRHISILAKSGSGKSYCAGVLAEEILEQGIPILVIDPHGEYGKLAEENNNADDLNNLELYNLKPKSYKNKITEYGYLNNLKPLYLNQKLTGDELLHIFPVKLSALQQTLLYALLQGKENFTFDSIIYDLQSIDNNNKFLIIEILTHLKNMNIFSSEPVSYKELIRMNHMSIVNLKGVEQETKEILIYKLLNDLFEERKKERIPPFFVIIEEAHNFVPERGFGLSKCAEIIRNIASEGRKFGLGLCLITQRPARIEKNVLSQCLTQIILKVTNPNDVKAIASSIEGITTETKDEMVNLPIGTAMITGIVDSPLFVNIRPRKTKHGGEAVDFSNVKAEEKVEQSLDNFKNIELISVIKPLTTKKDYEVMGEKVNSRIIPSILVECSDENTNFKVLVELQNGRLISNVENSEKMIIPDFTILQKNEIEELRECFKQKYRSDINSNILSLLTKGFLVKKDNVVELNPEMIFSKLSNYQCFYPINYENIDYNEKLQTTMNKEEIFTKLSKFVKINNHTDCFLLEYVPQKE